jgi:hypothetical protein
VVAGDDDDQEAFAKFLDHYLLPASDPNPEMRNVELVWVEDDPRFGVRHFEKHGITKQEVEEALLQIPPYVEAKRSAKHPERTLFWGATRSDRWIFIVCEDWEHGGVRYLKPITAFEPDEGEGYWNRFSS